MDHAVAVGVGERVGDVAEDAHRVADRQLALRGEPVAERLALDVGHDVVEEAVGLARVVAAAGCGDAAGPAAILISRRKRSVPSDGGELRAQHLDGDLAVVLQVLGEVHRGHAALAQLALDAVAVGQSGR